jgi:hypothetical protein
MVNDQPDHVSENPGVAQPDAVILRMSNAIRLSVREWVVAALMIVLIIFGVPMLWSSVEPFKPTADYRIPFASSEDYWLYRQLVENSIHQDRVLMIGDSVIWGEYVASHESLSHFLNEKSGNESFVNGGMNASHPLALEGLVRDYARDLVDRTVILHCNLLWMSSPERDLQIDSEVVFNHPRLAPQFFPKIPAYKAPISERLGILVNRQLAYRDCIAHFTINHFDSLDPYTWSLAHPYENPFRVPADQLDAPRHSQISWRERGIEALEFPWVDLETSLQWRAFRNSVELLRSRGNKVFVIVGPFNEHLLTDASRTRYGQLKRDVGDWLERHKVEFIVPEPLPSDDYADASHPLTQGYRRMAEAIFADQKFQHWLSQR